MPLPKPRRNESKDEFIARFMSNKTMISEYPDEKIRAGIAYSQWSKKVKKQYALYLVKRMLRIAKAKDIYDRWVVQLTDVMINIWDESYKTSIKELIRSIVRGEGDKPKKTEIKLLLDKVNEAMGLGVSGKMDEPVYAFTDKIYVRGQTDIIKSGLSFNLTDERALAWMRLNNNYWIGEHYGEHLNEQISKIGEAVLSKGLDRKAAAKYFQKHLGQQFKRSTWYWDLMANHVTTRSREFGRTEAYVKARIEYVKIVAVIDHRTSKICREMNGRIIPTRWMVETRDKILKSKKPEDVKKIAPWFNDKMTEEKIAGKETKKLPHSLGLPPYHGKCRTRTVIATEKEIKQEGF